MRTISYFLIFLSLVVLSSCERNVPDAELPEDINPGGETTVSGSTYAIFQQPAANLSDAEITAHLAADAAFGDKFVTAPNDINPGLGPVFNQNSCENCHTVNGKSPFPTSFTDTRGLLMRLSIPGEGPNGERIPVPGFGGQLQTRATYNVVPEATLSWQEIESIRTYADGEQVNLLEYIFNIDNLYTPMPAGVLTSMRMAPVVYGLGLLEAIRSADIEALADENDANSDGISGKPNRVWNYKKNIFELGRFGWKAGQPDLLQQTADAYHNDMGITSNYFPVESSYGQPQAEGFPTDPEIEDELLAAATFYSQSLGVPQRRNYDASEVIQGRKLFMQANCSGCHNPSFETGQHPEFSFLSQQKIWPYTDMLLHDMGNGLADNRPEFAANGKEWRTAPLWGIGMVQIVGGPQTRFLHDGRARTLEEAILWHGGEAEKSVAAYSKMSKNDRSALIKFLESL